MEDVSHILDELNDAQREAVSAPPGHMLVLAGAGSGKTRVLVHRIAWLIQVEHVSPLSILAVTFTNKAAGEMRERTQDLLQVSTRPLWIGTFHSIAHRLLRMHWREAGLDQNFQIIDSDDQQRLLRRIIREEGYDDLGVGVQSHGQVPQSRRTIRRSLMPTTPSLSMSVGGGSAHMDSSQFMPG